MADQTQYVPLDAQAAVIEYDAKFAQSLQGYPEPIGYRYAYKSTGTSLVRRFHIPLDAAGYEEFKGTLPFRILSQKFFDVTIQKWADGVAEDADLVEAIDFNGFSTQPEVMARNAKMFPDDKLAEIINTGENIALTWAGAGVNFLDTAHPVSLIGGGASGTFQNWWSNTDLTEANVTTLMNALLTRTGANGRSLGLKGLELLLPTALYEEGRRLVELPMLTGGESNPLFGRLKPVLWPQLDSSRWAIVDNSRPELNPLIIVTGSHGETPETITHDKDSYLYKSEMRVGFNAVLRMGFGPGMPHAIVVADED